METAAWGVGEMELVAFAFLLRPLTAERGTRLYVGMHETLLMLLMDNTHLGTKFGIDFSPDLGNSGFRKVFP